MDEYIGISMSGLRGLIPITKRIYVCLDKTCKRDSKFFDACESDDDFLNIISEAAEL